MKYKDIKNLIHKILMNLFRISLILTRMETELFLDRNSQRVINRLKNFNNNNFLLGMKNASAKNQKKMEEEKISQLFSIIDVN